MLVRDINDMDRRSKFQYRRDVDPLDPTYKLPSVSVNLKLAPIVAPIEGQKSRAYGGRAQQRTPQTLNIMEENRNAQPKVHGSVPMRYTNNDPVHYKNYN